MTPKERRELAQRESARFESLRNRLPVREYPFEQPAPPPFEPHPPVEIHHAILSVDKYQARRQATFACGHTIALLYHEQDRNVGEKATCRDCWKLAREYARVHIVKPYGTGWLLTCGHMIEEGEKPRWNVIIYCNSCQPGSTVDLDAIVLTAIVPRDPLAGLTPFVPKAKKPTTPRLSAMEKVKSRGPSTASIRVKPKHQGKTGKVK